MFYLVQILVPVGICVILPVLIVWIVFRALTNKDNRNAEIVIKALECNSEVDTDRLIAALGRKHKSEKEIRNGRLLRGCIFTLIGIVFGIFAAVLAITSPEGGGQYPSMLIAGVSLAIGISFLVVYYMTRKQHKDIDKD